jgi:hypothetical protein
MLLAWPPFLGLAWAALGFMLFGLALPGTSAAGGVGIAMFVISFPGSAAGVSRSSCDSADTAPDSEPAVTAS